MKKIFICLLIAFSLQASSYETGINLVKAGKYREGINTLKQAIEENQALNMDAYIYLVDAYRYLEEYQNMLLYCRRALRITQSRYEFFYLKAVAHFNLWQNEEALKDMEKALSLRPESAYLYNYLGLIHLRLGNLKAAESAFLFASNLVPSNSIYHNNLGAAYERQKKLKEAYLSYEKAATLNSNHKQAIENVERLTALFEKWNTPLPK